MEDGAPLLISWRMQHGPSDGTQAENPLSARNGVRAQHQDREVVALRSLLEGEQRRVDAARDLLGNEADTGAEQGAEAVLPEALTVTARRVGDAVGVEDERVARPQVQLVGLPGDLLERAQQRPRAPGGRGAVAGAQDVGRRVAGADQADVDRVVLV